MDISPDDILQAAARIAPHVHRTPLWTLPSTALGLPAGTPAFEAVLKLEHLQRSGSFKARGMFNRLLANPIPPAGVIAASGGNAGIATALAARSLGVPAEIFVPGISSLAKQQRLAELDANDVRAAFLQTADGSNLGLRPGRDRHRQPQRQNERCSRGPTPHIPILLTAVHRAFS